MNTTAIGSEILKIGRTVWHHVSVNMTIISEFSNSRLFNSHHPTEDFYHKILGAVSSIFIQIHKSDNKNILRDSNR